MIAVVVLGVWTLVAWWAARLLVVSAPLERADAIVVLSGSACLLERTKEAADLYNSNVASRVVLTNDNLRGPWSSVEQRNPFFYERAFDEIENAGVPADKIDVLMQPVNHTHEEAELVRRYALDHGIRSVLIVTSAYHSRRALWTFSRVFRDTDIIVGLIPASPGGETPRPATWWLTARGWKLVPTEYVKMIYYVVKYR